MVRRPSIKTVRRIRERIGSQVQVAEWLGVAPQTISRYETGALAIPTWYPLALSGLESFVVAISPKEKP